MENWHEANPGRWEAEQRIGRRLLDDFKCGVDAEVAFMEGVFHVRSEHGHTYLSARIRIEYPKTFPSRGQVPAVTLLSHRDTWIPFGDAHIFGNWRLCLFVPGESPVDFNRDDSLNGLFAVLHTFLFKERAFQRDLVRQALTSVPAIWPGAARSHNIEGVAEAVRSLRRVGRNAGCPCGSGKKYKKCCLPRLAGESDRG